MSKKHIPTVWKWIDEIAYFKTPIEDISEEMLEMANEQDEVLQSYFGTVRITIGCMDRMCQVTYYNDKREKKDIRGTSQEVADHINSLPNNPAQEGKSLS